MEGIYAAGEGGEDGFAFGENVVGGGVEEGGGGEVLEAEVLGACWGRFGGEIFCESFEEILSYEGFEQVRYVGGCELWGGVGVGVVREEG